MLNSLNDFNWANVFSYAGEKSEDVCSNAINCGPESAINGDDVDEEPFTREDVTDIFYIEEGEHDEEDWICIGKLKDGRYFSIEAGCDYTGWG